MSTESDEFGTVAGSSQGAKMCGFALRCSKKWLGNVSLIAQMVSRTALESEQRLQICL